MGLLVASHIKPWRDSSSRERLDPKNGIAACAAHDKAFDGGLLTVNGGFRIHQASELADRVAVDQAARNLFGPGTVQERLVLAHDRWAQARKYLEFHNERIFRSELHRA